MNLYTSFQLWVSSRTDWSLIGLVRQSVKEKKNFELKPFGNWPFVALDPWWSGWVNISTVCSNVNFLQNTLLFIEQIPASFPLVETCLKLTFDIDWSSTVVFYYSRPSGLVEAMTRKVTWHRWRETSAKTSIVRSASTDSMSSIIGMCLTPP